MEQSQPGKLCIIGLGPGGKEQMTLRAIQALEACDCVAGYGLYLDLIADMIQGKEHIETGMTKEITRCKAARDAALAGKNVALVSSGDAGVYGMAGLLLELCADYPELHIDIIPGVTAACSGGALLGSPLTCDFACISLSDLLIPWDVIQKRIRAAATGDFVMALYNPASRTRADSLRNACDLILETRPPETICGLVRNAGRQGETSQITSLGALRDSAADMLTTVFIGNSQTRIINGRIVTPRGYQGL